MGYYSDVTDEIYISPDLKVADIRKLINLKLAKTLDGQIHYDHCVYVDYEQHLKDYEDYTAVKFIAPEIKPTNSNMKAYSIVEDVQKIVDTLGEGYMYSGYIELNGEESGDLWRIYVRNGKAVEVKPEIVWPES